MRNRFPLDLIMVSISGERGITNIISIDDNPRVRFPLNLGVDNYYVRNIPTFHRTFSVLRLGR